MKNLLHLLSLTGMICFSFVVFQNEAPNTRVGEPQSTKSSRLDLDLAPAGDHIAFSSTLCAEQIKAAKEEGIRTIIRLNGDTPRDRGCLSITEERSLCEALGIDFHYFNIEGRVAAAYAEISELLREGYAIVHCRNGAHRAPGAMAYHLMRQAVPRERVIEVVGWERLVRAPGPYGRYVEAALGSYYRG